MPAKADIIGQKFNSLTVLSEAGRTDSGKVLWDCKCDCGSIATVSTGNLRSGQCKSCGCLHKETVTHHGFSDTKLYRIYQQIKQRCYNEKCKGYVDYGGRGIKVSDEWMEAAPEGFLNFKSDMGESYLEGLSIERLDNDGPYSAENCTWATSKEQSQNKRKRKNTTSKYRGVFLCKALSKFVAKVGVGGGKYKYLGNYEEEILAAEAYDNYIRSNNLNIKLNFEERK